VREQRPKLPFLMIAQLLDRPAAGLPRPVDQSRGCECSGPHLFIVGRREGPLGQQIGGDNMPRIIDSWHGRRLDSTGIRRAITDSTGGFPAAGASSHRREAE
jgi:hypothetical protein